MTLHTHTHTQPFYGSVEFVRDNLDEPVPEETFTHSLMTLAVFYSDRFTELLENLYIYGNCYISTLL